MKDCSSLFTLHYLAQVWNVGENNEAEYFIKRERMRLELVFADKLAYGVDW